MISKKVLSAVIGKEIVKVTFYDHQVEFRFNECQENGLIYDTINVFELMNLCKIWAINEYNIITATRVYGDDMFMVILRENDDHVNFIRKYTKKTEPKAVFRACKYILEERTKSD